MCNNSVLAGSVTHFVLEHGTLTLCIYLPSGTFVGVCRRSKGVGIVFGHWFTYGRNAQGLRMYVVTLRVRRP